MKVIIKKSNSKNKKWDISLYKNGTKVKKLSIGDSRYEDYTQHKDDNRKALYKSRHRNEDWDDYYTKGFWAKHLLWNKKTLKKSIEDIEENYPLSVIPCFHDVKT